MPKIIYKNAFKRRSNSLDNIYYKFEKHQLIIIIKKCCGGQSVKEASSQYNLWGEIIPLSNLKAVFLFVSGMRSFSHNIWEKSQLLILILEICTANNQVIL